MKKLTGILFASAWALFVISWMWSPAAILSFCAIVVMAVVSVCAPRERDENLVLPFHYPTGQSGRAA